MLIKNIDKRPNSIHIVNEAKKYYLNIDERIIEAVQISLNDMNLPKTSIDKIIMLIAIACDKHYKYGFHNAKKNKI